MITVLEALRFGEAEIKSSFAEKITKQHNAKLDAQILLAFCLKKPTAYLFSHVDDHVPESALSIYRGYLKRRRSHEPVAYILGEKAFFGHHLFVTPNVLIPRPETEQLVEIAIAGATEDTTYLDVGTGSGAIAVTLARETGRPVIATDTSTKAIDVAKNNADRLHVNGKISFLHGHLLEPYLEKNIHSTNGRMIITANLPYVPTGNWQALDPDVKMFEPKLALVGGLDGLDLYDILLMQLQTHRANFPKDLILLMEIEPSQEHSLPRLVQEHFPATDVEVIHDLASKPRIVTASIL